jgi:integrase
MRVKLTPAFIAKPPLPAPPKDREIYWDEELRGFGLMVTANGQTAFVVQYRTSHKSRRMHLKPGLSLQEARREAKKLLGDVARGHDPLARRQKAAHAGADTLYPIANEYLKRGAKDLRSRKQREAILKRHIFPKLGSHPIGEIRRSDIVRLLDRIDDQSGPSAADHALAILSRVMSWHASRSDDFRSPIVRGMRRTSQRERARSRILSDHELRAVWKAAETSTSLVGPFVQFLLLTACRRTEASHMARSEVVGDTWTIPAGRYKTGLELVVPVTPMAMQALTRLPNLGKFVFSPDGVRPFTGYSKAKAK